MMMPRRFGLLAQLLTGFLVGMGLMAILLFYGNHLLDRSVERLNTMIERQVRPLARLHQLQSDFDALRNLELELPHLQDIFAIQSQTTRILQAVAAFDVAIRHLSTDPRTALPKSQAERLQGHWQDYRAHVERQLRLADELAKDELIKSHLNDSQIPYQAIRQILTEIAQGTEADAVAAYQSTLDEFRAQRIVFLLFALLSAGLLAAGVAASGHLIMSRIYILRDHAQKLAEGGNDDPIQISRIDEIGDLADTFEAMRSQIRTREAELETARRDLESRVRQRTADLEAANRQLLRFAEVVEQNPIGIVIARLGGATEFVNSAYCRIVGLPPEEIVGHPLEQTLALCDGKSVKEAIEHAAHGQVWESEQPGRRNSPVLWERLRLLPIRDTHAAISHLLLMREDISEQKRQLERIAYQAHYDALTGLPNRVLANDRLQQAIHHCRREQSKLAVLYLDLDNFKEINDTLGHVMGDKLLCAFAHRLSDAVRDEDIVARLGGDEFLLVVSDLVQGSEAAAVAEKVIGVLATPIVIDEREIMTTTSIGIAIYPNDGDSALTLLRNADLAMYEAKEAGRSTYRFYDPSIHAQSLRRLEIGRCLRGAVARNELRLVYQPLLNAQNGQIIGAEALVRWRHPDLGEVSPAEFIPIAEQSGLIIDIGSWVMRNACERLSEWLKIQPDFRMAINVSARQLHGPGFIKSVESVIQEYALSADHLEFEVTESLLMRNRNEARNLLDRLHVLGAHVAIDDFGTGYSSLSYLREFSFHTLKIDRSFIRDITHDSGDRALVSGAIRMAHALGLKVVAEGVEQFEQWALLREEGCDFVQGYLFSPPTSPEEFATHWLNGRFSS